ncbi:MAG: class I SAM-dependent methyltransferase [Tildeniella torsiva UHER 1998/13D]|jgi:predicted O-methyltransferase YrrM|nr:class I SAM-dependent methyltransferase [Tildeniella torsiva UHER 1998/13D]
MASKTLDFLSFTLGFRSAKTSDTKDELSFLGLLAKGKKCVVEVGVFEGAASKIICENMDIHGILYLVDPYFKSLKIERVLNFSTTEYIARKNLDCHKGKTKFVKKTSIEAAKTCSLNTSADLIFIDAQHDYTSVLQDFKAWAPLLSDNGVMAFHDSQICDARPDLNSKVGPVRLCHEIFSGLYAPWRVVDTVDSITVIAKVQ